MTKTIELSLKKYPIEIIRYAAYSVSNIFWVKIEKNSNETVKVCLIPKNDNFKIKDKEIQKTIMDEIKNETIRQKILKENKNFRYNIIKKAITYQPVEEDPTNFSLTPEEQKELEKLLQEIEEEIKEELKKEKKDDIRKTWEEKYGKRKK